MWKRRGGLPSATWSWSPRGASVTTKAGGGESADLAVPADEEARRQR